MLRRSPNAHYSKSLLRSKSGTQDLYICSPCNSFMLWGLLLVPLHWVNRWRREVEQLRFNLETTLINLTAIPLARIYCLKSKRYIIHCEMKFFAGHSLLRNHTFQWKKEGIFGDLIAKSAQKTSVMLLLPTCQKKDLCTVSTQETLFAWPLSCLAHKTHRKDQVLNESR
jgi:hypothetical protein